MFSKYNHACLKYIVSTIKKLVVKDFLRLIFKNYNQRIGFAKENSYYSIKDQKKKDAKSFATKLTEKKTWSSQC